MGTHTPVQRLAYLGGWQHIYRFTNGYGASVIDHQFSYGRELAVIRFGSEDLDDFGLVYDTPVTDDVIGHLDDDRLADVLDEIAGLPNPALR